MSYFKATYQLMSYFKASSSHVICVCRHAVAEKQLHDVRSSGGLSWQSAW
jgi:hypothetical protein